MIALDLQTFRQRLAGGNVTGVIFLTLDKREFPDGAWSDFPVVVLSWWIDAWLQLEVPARRRTQWDFMDGPQVVTLTKVNGVPPTGAFQSAEVRDDLLKAAESVVAHCEKHGMLGEDLDALRGNVLRLRANPPAGGNAGFSILLETRHQRPAVPQPER